MLGYQSIDGVPITANQLAAQRRAQERVGLHRHAGHRLGQRRPDGLGTAGLRRPTSRPPRSPFAPGTTSIMTTPQFFDGRAGGGRPRRCVESRRSTTPSAGSCASSSSSGCSRTRGRPTAARQAAVIGCRRTPPAQPGDGPPLAGAAAQRRHPAARRRADRDRRRRATATGAEPRRSRSIGPNADDPHAQLGDWAGASGQVNWMPDGHPRETVRDGARRIPCRRVRPTGRSRTRAEPTSADLVPDPAGAILPDGQPRPPLFAARPDRRRRCCRRPSSGRGEADYAVVGRRRHRRPHRRRLLHGHPRPAGRPDRAAGRGRRHRHTRSIVVLVQSKPSDTAAIGARRPRPSSRPSTRDAGRPGHRRTDPRTDRAQRPAPDLLRPPRRASSPSTTTRCAASTATGTRISPRTRCSPSARA